MVIQYINGVLTAELWQFEFAVQPPLSGALHSSMSSQTWIVKNEQTVTTCSDLIAPKNKCKKYPPKQNKGCHINPLKPL